MNKEVVVNDVWSEREMVLISWLGHRVPLWVMIACAIIAGTASFGFVLQSQITAIRQNILEMRADIASKVTASDRRDQIDLVIGMIAATNKRIEDATQERNDKFVEVNERLRYLDLKVDSLLRDLRSEFILPSSPKPRDQQR